MATERVQSDHVQHSSRQDPKLTGHRRPREVLLSQQIVVIHQLIIVGLQRTTPKLDRR